MLDEARKLPETLPGIPVRIIGLAMQQAMKAQQTYAGFVARGDELFTGFRGDDEPGLATFDDEEEPLPAPGGFRESAFDRAGDTEPTSAGPDLIVDDLVEAALEDLAGAAPDTAEILDEIAIDELVDQAPTLEETAPAATRAAKAAVKAAAKPAKAPKAPKPAKATKPAKPHEAAAAPAPTQNAPVTKNAAAQESALLEAALQAAPAATEPTADVATPVDVLPTAGEVAAVEATVTDEAVAAPETPAADAPAPAPETPAEATTAAATTPTATPEPTTSNNGAGSRATSPIDGYDSFTVAQLRGRMRGYALSTVQDLVSYEEATRARAPYLTMLRNRLEKLEEQAVASSPLAPRGA